MQQLFTTPGHISKNISCESLSPTKPNDLTNLLLHFPPSGFLINGALTYSGVGAGGVVGYSVYYV